MTDTNLAELNVLSLEQLAAALGAPPAELFHAVVTAQSREAFIELGRSISSDKIDTDTTRIYGLAWQFWREATDEQKFLLVGFSPDLLALGVDVALKLRTMSREAAADTKTSAAEHNTRGTARRAAMTQGHALNDLAETTLRSVVGKDRELMAKVDGVCSASPDYDLLARSLRAKAALLREFMAHSNDALAVRVSAARIAEAFPMRLEDMAKTVEETGQSAKAAIRRGVDQGEVDLMDGVNLYLLAEIIRVFDAAHNIDSTIPRLVPIATRRALGRRDRKKTVEPA